MRIETNLRFSFHSRRYFVRVRKRSRTHTRRGTRPRRRDVTDQCCRGVARPFAAVRVAGGSRALGYVRPRSGLLARSYGEERQLLFDTRAEESVRYLAVRGYPPGPCHGVSSISYEVFHPRVSAPRDAWSEGEYRTCGIAIDLSCGEKLARPNRRRSRRARER